MLAPRETAEMLLVLSEVVRTHFFLPRPAMLDPVVTSNDSMLRFEGFSGCCGVYARVDIPAEAFHCDHLGRGTTNVDFNNPMRAALSRLRNHDDARLAVGADGVELSKAGDTIVEKKVKLPVRWIKGFSEVQPLPTDDDPQAGSARPGSPPIRPQPAPQRAAETAVVRHADWQGAAAQPTGQPGRRSVFSARTASASSSRC